MLFGWLEGKARRWEKAEQEGEREEMCAMWCHVSCPVSSCCLQSKSVFIIYSALSRSWESFWDEPPCLYNTRKMPKYGPVGSVRMVTPVCSSRFLWSWFAGLESGPELFLGGLDLRGESWLRQFTIVSAPALPWHSALTVRMDLCASLLQSSPFPYSPVLTSFLHLAVPDEVSWAWLPSMPSRSYSPASNISLAFCTYSKRRAPPHGWRILDLISCSFLSWFLPSTPAVICLDSGQWTLTYLFQEALRIHAWKILSELNSPMKSSSLIILGAAYWGFLWPRYCSKCSPDMLYRELRNNEPVKLVFWTLFLDRKCGIKQWSVLALCC